MKPFITVQEVNEFEEDLIATIPANELDDFFQDMDALRAMAAEGWASPGYF